MSNFMHGFWAPLILGAIIQAFALDPLIIGPTKDWIARMRLGKQRLLEEDMQIRWHKNGGQAVEVNWRHHGGAWWRCITWRWSKEGRERREMWRHIPLPPRDLPGCN